MKLFYIIFFIVLDLMFFSFLVKKIRLGRRRLFLLTVFLFFFTIIHFLNPFGLAISNEVFYILIGFSMTLIVSRFAKEVAIWVTSTFNREKNELFLKWFSIWVDYVMYIMVLIFQIATIISN